MAKVDPDKLEKIIADAGLGGRSAAKLRRANDDAPAPAKASKPRRSSGFGAPNQDLSAFAEV